VPDIEAWQAGYTRWANDVPGQAPTFEEANDLAQRLLNPVLAGPVAALWNPITCQWENPTVYPAIPGGRRSPEN